MVGKNTLRALKRIASTRGCSEDEAHEFLQEVKTLAAPSPSARSVALAVEQLGFDASPQDVAQLALKLHQQMLNERMRRRRPVFETTGGQVHLVKPGYYKKGESQ